MALLLVGALLAPIAATRGMAATRGATATTTTPLPLTPGGKLEVIVENLREANPAADDIFGNNGGTGPYAGCGDTLDYPRCGREMLNLARRLANKLSVAPDVMLVEESAKVSLQLLSQYMLQYLGHSYSVVKIPDPDRRWVTISGVRYRITSNTSIMINNDTMKVLDPGGYLTVHQKPEDQLVGDPTNKYPLMGQREAYILLQQKSTGMTVAAAALHYATFNEFSTTHQGALRKAEWSQQILQYVYGKYPSADLYLFGGELNGGRCKKAPETVNCNLTDKDHVMPFWPAFTGAPYNLKDTVWWTHNASDADLLPQVDSRNGKDRRIDYAFTSGYVYRATRDLTYDADPYKVTHSAQASWGFISDHRWVDSLVGLPPSKVAIHRVRVGTSHISVGGTALPAQVSASLYADQGGVWQSVTTKQVSTLDGHFSVRFPRPTNTTMCKVDVSFPGDRTYAASSDSRTFSC